MISKIYNTPYVLSKSGSRKGKSWKQINEENKKIVDSFKKQQIRDKKLKDKIFTAMNNPHLSDWEKNFLTSLSKFKTPSVKQLEVLHKILNKR